MYSKLQDIYSQSSVSVRPKGLSEESAREVYHKYIDFVNNSVSESEHGRLLDIGCGSGWSSYLFRQHNYQVVGIDSKRIL